MSYDSFAIAGSVSVYLFGVGGLKIEWAKLMGQKWSQCGGEIFLAWATDIFFETVFLAAFGFKLLAPC